MREAGGRSRLWRGWGGVRKRGQGAGQREWEETERRGQKEEEERQGGWEK